MDDRLPWHHGTMTPSKLWKRGNQPAGHGGTAGPDHGGTAGPGDRNEFLFREVRTPSGKPGWGIFVFSVCVLASFSFECPFDVI